MPYIVRHDPTLHAVVARAFGPGDRAEGLRLLTEAFAVAAQTRARAIIIDILELEFVPSSSDANVFVGQMREFPGMRGRIAVVAPAGAPYGVARMVGMLAEIAGTSVTVCTSMEEATAWAGATSSDSRPGGAT